ncbi:conjugal transfer protein TraV [Klebsiella pneumoniae]|nr:conjugal transfer protein TraV [Klebsiella pneumoniae]
MKELMLLIPLGGALLLTGCAGTETEFQCNATTSDTCMTMEQANEKAKLKEERSDAKPAAAGLPQLAEGNFRTTSVNSYPLPPQSNLTQARVAAEKDRARAVYLKNEVIAVHSVGELCKKYAYRGGRCQRVCYRE